MAVLLMVGCTAASQEEPEVADEAFPREVPRGYLGSSSEQVQDMPDGGELSPEEKCQIEESGAVFQVAGVLRSVKEWVLSATGADSADDYLSEEEKGYTC